MQTVGKCSKLIKIIHFSNLYIYILYAYTYILYTYIYIYCDISKPKGGRNDLKKPPETSNCRPDIPSDPTCFCSGDPGPDCGGVAPWTLRSWTWWLETCVLYIYIYCDINIIDKIDINKIRCIYIYICISYIVYMHTYILYNR